MSVALYEFWRGKRSESGTSAIEFALILPAIVLLYIGTIDLNGYISVTRKVSTASGILSDLITQSISNISAATIDDAFKGAALSMTPVPENMIGREIQNYRLVDGDVVQQWRRTSASGPDCSTPDTTGLAELMAGGNDIIIAVVCTVHEPAMSRSFNNFVLGADTFTIESAVRLRPRESNTLDCLDC